MKKLLFVILLNLTYASFFGQNNEVWDKISPEIRMNIKNSPIEIRWRPIDMMIMPDHYFGKHSLVRTDLMLGANIWKFKVFNYTKYDEFHRLWTGVRLDFNFNILNKKLLINIQERYFWGLNNISSNHYYLIQYARYMVCKNVHLGVLSYGKWNTDMPFNQGDWFIGPSVYYILPYNFNLHIAYTKQIFAENIYMLFLRVGYKFNLDFTKQKNN